MITLGVTGGMGSGKTEFCNELTKLGAFVVNADSLAKHLMTTDPQLKLEIKEAFGSESYLPDETLNRPYLAEQAFRFDGVDRLNKIVHPRVSVETFRLQKEALQKEFPIFVKEAALLLLNGRPDGFDKIILIKANRRRRIKRIEKRDQISIEEIITRMNIQQSDEELESIADILVTNDGTLEDLKAQARKLFRDLMG